MQNSHLFPLCKGINVRAQGQNLGLFVPKQRDQILRKSNSAEPGGVWSLVESLGQHPLFPTERCVVWQTSPGSAYYDNVRPLAYPDSDAVLICFDISRPETLDSVLKKWQGETQEFCPNAKIVLVGCKLDMRTDLNTLRELSKQRLIPVTHEQGSALARQIGAVAYAECSSKVSENSVRDVFHVTTLASVNRVHKNLKRSNSKRGLKRASQMPGRTDLLSDTEIRKDRAKSCSIM
ncbi:PREDICTED: rho-related GTP-binding protein RhoN [Calidris pugnax]|uniref:rho-related GTP-binding protein RhoN n=1 Tax=Calidris pugnax TaxID=198806 RepID=UPI00071D9264|nr:PREDICTED: rho-related GTP-binding protein RhoN [Calidris pugnax]